MKVVWNVPNVLTLLRVIAAPLLAYFLMRGYYEYALCTFTLAALTDVLDGYIARRFDLYTEFGAALDPLADKLVTLTCLLILTFQLFILVLTHAAQLIDASDWLTASFVAVLATSLASLAQYVVRWGRKAAREARRP